LAAGRTLEFFAADAAEGAHHQVIAGLRQVLEDLAADGPSEAELAMWHAARRQVRDAPQAILGQLDSTAERQVLGLETPLPEEVEDRLAALTLDELRDDLANVAKTMLVIGPNDLGQQLDGLSPVDNWSESQILGEEYQPIDGRERGTLVVGDDGVCWILDDAHCRTVRWDEAVGVLAWDSGLRSVVGPTGISVVVAPWNWRRGEELTEIIDRRVGSDRLMRIGEGDAEYRLDPADADSVARLRWLASLVGVGLGKERVDLALMTDGVLLLHRAGPVATKERLKELRSRSREELVEATPHSTWWPLEAIRSVSLARPRAVRFGKSKVCAVLKIDTTNAGPVVLDLYVNDHVTSVKGEFPRIFGAKFESRI
jgi:hypothetical protein